MKRLIIFLAALIMLAVTVMALPKWQSGLTIGALKAGGGSEKKVVYLNNYNLFGSYTLNYHNPDREIFLSIGSESGDFIANIYKSTAAALQANYFTHPRFDEGENNETKAPAVAKYQGKTIETHEFSLKPEATTPSIKIKSSESGIYYVEIKKKDDKSSNQTYGFFLTITRYAATSQRLGDTLLTWVVDEQTGKRVSEAKVQGFGKTNSEIIFAGMTDDQGLIKTTIPQESEKVASLLEINFHGEIFHNFLGQSSWESIYSGDYRYDLDNLKAYIYTDRPIYRPGDTVNFKMVLRRNKADILTPITKKITILAKETTYGQGGNVIYEKKLTTNKTGTVADSFNLSKEIKSGDYELSVQLDNKEIGRASLGVEYYQKPDFAVTLETDKTVYLKGQTITGTVKAVYFFGEPVKQGTVKLRSHTYHDDQLSEQELKLNDAGEAKFNIKTTDFNLPGQSWWSDYSDSLTLETSVADSDQKESTATKILSIYSSEYRVSLSSPENFYYGLQKNKSYELIFKVEENLTSQAKANYPLTLSLKKDQYWRSSDEKHILLEKNGQTNEAGEVHFKIEFPEDGAYDLFITGKDSLGNVFNHNYYVWIGSNFLMPNNQDDPKAVNLKIVPDKESYQVGDTAKLTFILPQSSGDVLWSVNKKIFHKVKVDEVASANHVILVPITKQLIPGFYIYATMFNGQDFASSGQLITVNGQKLTVEVNPAKKNFLPGEDIELTVTTRDDKNQPVAAESSLSVVDKAIFALKSDQTVDPFAYFYPTPQDWMQTIDSLRVISPSFAEKGGCFLAGTKILMADFSFKNIEDVQPNDKILTKEYESSSHLVEDTVVRRFEHLVTEFWIINNSLKITPVHRVFLNGRWQPISEAKIGDWLIDINQQKVMIESIAKVQEEAKVYNLETAKYHTFFADGIYVHNDKGGSSIRSDFVDTAYWNSSVKTDESGQAKVKFKLPDNLTTWVAATKTFTRDTKIGQGTTEFVVSKDLIIRPLLPTFVRRGDSVLIPVLVHNNLKRGSNFRVLAEADGLQFSDGQTRELAIKQGEVGRVSYQVQADTALPKIKWRFTVIELGNNTRDAVDLTIPVYSNLSVYKEIISGVLPTSINFTADSETQATFTLTPSVVASLPAILEKLTGYPYGCTEQTMSKHLPNILVYLNQKTLGLKAPADWQKNLDEGFDRLYKFQHSDGGFGWWESDDNNIWMSGYIFEGLLKAKEAGLLKNKVLMYDRLLSYLKDRVGKLKPDEQAYVIYGLSQANEAKMYKTILNNLLKKALAKEELDIQSQGYVALALQQTGRVQEAKKVLENIRLQKQDDNHFELKTSNNNDNFDFHGTMKDRFSATGVNLLALVKIDYRSDETGKIVQWLMRNRTGYEGLWGSTRQSSQILDAVMEYLKKTTELYPNYSYEIFLNGQKFKSDTVSNKNYSLKIDLPKDKLTTDNTIEIRQSGTGNIYWSLNLGRYAEAQQVEGQAKNITIKREYLKDNKPVTSFVTGDLIKIRLIVKAEDNPSYVMIEDYLPAGFTAVNTRLENEGKTNDHDDWWANRDFRDEKVAFFASALWNRESTFEYTARVTHEGTFTAPAPRLELMYEPETFRLDQTSLLSVKRK